jgi:hypothetical protein
VREGNNVGCGNRSIMGRFATACLDSGGGKSTYSLPVVARSLHVARGPLVPSLCRRDRIACHLPCGSSGPRIVLSGVAERVEESG